MRQPMKVQTPRLRAEASTAAFVALIIALVLAAGLMAYTIYVNQQGSISFGSDAAFAKAVSFSNTYNEKTEVGLDNGVDANVNWDGKAVAVVGVGGQYVEVKNLKYYIALSWGKGTKAENGCPFYAFLTGATRYDVKILSANAYKIASSGSKNVRIDYSPEVYAALVSLNVPAETVNVNGRLEIQFPVHVEEWYAYVKAQFYYGHSGIFGGCPSLNPDHGGYTEGSGTILAIG